ncbi:MAG: CotH kinase family protein, partial [Candidatus Marinimicrobia bacterium]|nr:CotH kinase family protein [Candidatus Neomarinimicrobiota bacterium]
MIHLLSIFLFLSIVLGQGIVFNEIMSSNGSTIYDEDGDTPDWIELYNGNDSSVSLGGYGISDDLDDPFKWTFPDIELPAGNHLLLFASDKDRSEIHHWETVIAWGDDWHYRIGDSEPSTNWNTISFDDSDWSIGPSGFGYGDDDDSTVISPTVSIYLRNTFTIENIDQISAVFLHADYDDAFVAYLNGSEIARANIGEPGTTPSYDQGADTWREANIYQGGFPESFELDLQNINLVSGENTLAIQVHNYDINSSDLTLIPFFTLGFDTVIEDPNGTPDLVVLPNISLHTNFKISSSGETLTLTMPSGDLVDQLETGQIPTDISYGRLPDGGTDWFFFDEPTPETANVTEGFQGLSNQPQFFPNGGFYTSVLELSLETESPTATIYYTIDATEPNESSFIYTNPIVLNTTTIVRAKVIDSGWIPSPTITHTYFQNVESDLPIISLTTAPINLWDEETGIYAMGNDASENFPYLGANFWEDWEKPIHIELFESDGDANLRMDAGVKIFGGWSRGFPQKSLSIFARSVYGSGEINYSLFSDRPFHNYEAFVLRNSGNDWNSSMLRDGFLTGIINNTRLDHQAFRPTIVYLNGDYWGIHNLREKINEHFIASHHNIDPENIDLLEFNGMPIVGDTDHYDNLMEFIETRNLSITENYDYVQTQMDIDNFILYQLTQIFIDNRDWPGNNIKFWREKVPNGKWQWILYDTDFGFGVWDPNAYAFNTLEFAADPNGSDWPNPPWSTFLFRSLLENESFRFDFINQFCDHLNTTFKPDRVIQLLNQKANLISDEITIHINLWQNIINWNYNISQMENFANLRLPYIRSHIQTFFDLEEMVLIQISLSPVNGGHIKLNSIELTEFPFNGHYYKEIPITLSAIPANGFEFTGWSGVDNGDSSQITIMLIDDMSITAHFTPVDEGEIVINEINYNSSSDFDSEDWVEIFNGRHSDVDLSGWTFKDSEDDHQFILPNNIELNTGEYLILCRDTTAFMSLFPNQTNFIGNFNFGLSGSGELIRLFNQTGVLIDEVEYDDHSPWPEEADGNGPTLELINPNEDNEL